MGGFGRSRAKFNKGITNRDDKPVKVDGLSQEIVGSEFHRPGSKIYRAVAGEHDDTRWILELHKLPEDFHAVHTLHPQIQKDHWKLVLLHQPQGLVTVLGGHAGQRVRGEEFMHELNEDQLVIDDEYRGLFLPQGFHKGYAAVVPDS